MMQPQFGLHIQRPALRAAPAAAAAIAHAGYSDYKGLEMLVEMLLAMSTVNVLERTLWEDHQRCAVNVVRVRYGQDVN